MAHRVHGLKASGGDLAWRGSKLTHIAGPADVQVLAVPSGLSIRKLARTARILANAGPPIQGVGFACVVSRRGGSSVGALGPFRLKLLFKFFPDASARCALL